MKIDPELDYHRQKAADYFKIPYEEVTPEQRKFVKEYYFAEAYGIGNKKLSDALAADTKGIAVSPDDIT